MSFPRTKSTAATKSRLLPSLTLIADANARTKRFALCSEDGKPLYSRRFFDREINGKQPSCDMAVAKSAVWLAAQIKESIGAAEIHLLLKVDAEWLTWANEVAKGGKRGGKARALGEYAISKRVVLNVEHIPGVSNPATRHTLATDFKKWQDNDWHALVAKTRVGQSQGKEDRARRQPLKKAKRKGSRQAVGSAAALTNAGTEAIQERGLKKMGPLPEALLQRMSKRLL